MTLALSRWLGGKRWLTIGYPHLLPSPRRGGRAFDCFAGSCVVAFHWLEQGYRVVIGDTNARLIGCLRNLQERPEAVIGTLEAEVSAYTDAKDQRADFYMRREHLNRIVPESLESSALFLFMLRAGFNGLWRENSLGECNTTWGDPHNVNKAGQRQHVRMKDLVSADELRTIASLLKRADIRLGDFEVTSADARRGDVLFADAPYVDPAKAAFVGYSKGGFTLRDRQRLSAWLREMDRRGVRWTATDAALPHVRATYGLWTMDEVQVRRSCSAKSEGRGMTPELIVTNGWNR
jgi:DNA adenine methylase